jgi:translation initiation factor 2 subunit 3
MSKDLLPEITVGLTGHVDHGKTTLTYALTGKWTMLHSEELKRGITIKLGYADAEIRRCKSGQYTIEKKCPDGSESESIRKISFVDAPGHETLMAVMLSGAAIMDGAILVIAANEPVPQPQTAEHLMALKILGIEKIIVVQNKVDLVTKDKAIENYKQIQKFVKETLGRDVPIIPVSGQRKANIDLLLEAIQELFPTPKRDDTKDPLMMVARSFDINKPGTNLDKLVGGVLGGAIAQGKFQKGMKVEIRPGRKIEKKGGQVEWRPITTTIMAIAAGNLLIDEKGPGGSVAISTTLDPALTKADAFVGSLVGLPGKLPPVVHALEIKTNLFEFVAGTKEHLKLEPFKQYEPLMLNLGTATTIGIIQSSGKTMKLALRRPICAKKGDKVAIGRQVQNRWHLIGYGIVL